MAETERTRLENPTPASGASPGPPRRSGHPSDRSVPLRGAAGGLKPPPLVLSRRGGDVRGSTRGVCLTVRAFRARAGETLPPVNFNLGIFPSVKTYDS